MRVPCWFVSARVKRVHFRFIASLKARFKFSAEDRPCSDEEIVRANRAPLWGQRPHQRTGTGMSEQSGQGLRGEPTSAANCFERGIVYSSGREVEVDLVEAHKWFNIAAARGHAEGAQMRREIAELMSDADIGRAQRAARDWLSANPLPVRPVEIRAAA